MSDDFVLGRTIFTVVFFVVAAFCVCFDIVAVQRRKRLVKFDKVDVVVDVELFAAVFIVQFLIVFVVFEIGRILIPYVQQLTPLFDETVELAATTFAEFVRRTWMIRLSCFPIGSRNQIRTWCETLQTGANSSSPGHLADVTLVLGCDFAVVDLLLSFFQRFSLVLNIVGELLVRLLILQLHFFDVPVKTKNFQKRSETALNGSRHTL